MSTAVRLWESSLPKRRSSWVEMGPVHRASSSTGPGNSVPPIRRNWMYAPGMKSRGLRPKTSIPTTVGTGSSTDAIIRVAARRSSVLRSFAASSSGSNARGR